MPKLARVLTALEVKNLTSPGFHMVGGTPGLALVVRSAAVRSWILRAVVAGKRRDIGLGAYPATPLARAREDAAQARELIRSGIDPIEKRRAQASALRAQQLAAMTFQEAAEAFIKGQKAAWNNDKHALQWTSTLTTYAYPVVGRMFVRDIELSHVLAVLEPIWRVKTETATRVRGRIESVLDWATVRGHRQGLNPARWKGHLDKILPKPGKVAKVRHHEALDIGQVAAFMAKLRGQGGVGARALEFAILTAARSGEVRGATWDELDLEGRVWTIPGKRMKAGKEHRVPLSAPALALVKTQPRIAKSPQIFSAMHGGVLSDMTLSAVIRRMKEPCVPHGFRSTFRDWVSECTNYPGDMAEMALAHAISSKVEAAYRRGDMFEKRRQMMDDWARFCSGMGNAKPEDTA